ncbi:TlpA family protein disulfide reductase [Sphingobacterium sp. xlx-130]|uniref:TlpA family protein disulfide reductase n=1 Tax=Sphingobacterium sp. xlx-130 TaxID=2654323 RepID=UPI0013DC5CF1|nr:hypothetical protein [Sphingobacterium sp. xlx-130]
MKKGIEMLEAELALIKNDTLKGDALLSYLKMQKEYPNYKIAQDKYKQYLLTESQVKQNRHIRNEMAQLQPGDPGLNFKFADHKGNEVQFSDLKGKVVLVNVWATYYKITGIPRFMIFDKKGEIVTINSPRPSNPQLKELLEELLKED